MHHEGWGHFAQSQQDLQKAFAAVGREQQLQKVAGGETYVFEKAYARAP